MLSRTPGSEWRCLCQSGVVFFGQLKTAFLLLFGHDLSRTFGKRQVFFQEAAARLERLFIPYFTLCANHSFKSIGHDVCVVVHVKKKNVGCLVDQSIRNDERNDERKCHCTSGTNLHTTSFPVSFFQQWLWHVLSLLVDKLEKRVFYFGCNPDPRSVSGFVRDAF